MTKLPRLGKSTLPAPYEVGYGKPPASTRFRKGQSGNPGGRPKGARNKLPALHEERLKDIVLAEAYRDIKVHDGDRQVTVPMAEAIIRSMALKAAKGDHRSQKLFSDLLNRTEASRKSLHDAWLENAFDYKVQWERELERRERLGSRRLSPCRIPMTSRLISIPERCPSAGLLQKSSMRPGSGLPSAGMLQKRRSPTCSRS